MIKRLLVLSVILSLALGLLPVHAVSRYVPRQGDYFQYSEVINLSNATGAWYGYSEHETVSGTERMNFAYSNGTIASNYTYTWNWSNSSGSTQSGNPAGDFTWSSSTNQYVKGNDSQTGFVKPLYVWFYMDNTTQRGGTFRLLNTLMTVSSIHYNYPLTLRGNVWTIRSTGTGGYQRDYGNILFDAAYSWTTYSDPSTGYIIGYDYIEQDTSSTVTFTWSDSLHVTSTSYPLTSAPAIPPPPSPLLGYIVIALVVLLVIIIIAVLAYSVARRRRNRLPKQLFQSVPQQYPTQPPPQIDLTPRQPPPEQIVIREIVKVKCRYCGALIDGTAQTCPFCGAPRT